MSGQAKAGPDVPPMSAEINGRVDLGERLRQLRKQRGWTLQEMADHVHLAISTLSKVENRQMSLTYESLLKIANGVRIDIAELLSRSPPATIDGRISVTQRHAGRKVVNDDGSDHTAALP